MTQVNKGWVGFDLDGTLAVYDGWKGIGHIGEPIQSMILYLKDLLALGIEVRIVTARVQEGPEAIFVVEGWCLRHIGQVLPVTDMKDFSMVCLFDDRVERVEKNKGWLRLEAPTPLELAKIVTDHWSNKNPESPNYGK